MRGLREGGVWQSPCRHEGGGLKEVALELGLQEGGVLHRADAIKEAWDLRESFTAANRSFAWLSPP